MSDDTELWIRRRLQDMADSPETFGTRAAARARLILERAEHEDVLGDCMYCDQPVRVGEQAPYVAHSACEDREREAFQPKEER